MNNQKPKTPNSKHQTQKVLVADDDQSIVETLFDILSRDGYHISVYDPQKPDDSLLEQSYAIAIFDLMMPNTDGFSLREKLIEYSPDTQFIFITGYPDRNKLEKAMDLGVYTFLTKPFTADHIRYAVLGALRIKKLIRKFQEKDVLLSTESLGLIGRSREMERVRKKILEAAPLDLPVLVTGDSGTGKEVVSRCIHQFSKRSDKQFTVVNCAGLSATLIESELFGHAQGAFTGATKIKHGFFEVSDGGTVFLDEIGELPLELQGKLLRVLDCGELNRVGETETRKVDVRIISATNRNIQEMVKEKVFREDLYYRLCGSQIHLPPLQERKKDILNILHYFIGDKNTAITPEAQEMLQDYSWPGNVRELRMVTNTLKGISHNGLITKDIVSDILDAQNQFREDVTQLFTYKQFKQKVLKQSEKRYFENLLELTKYNISKASRIADIDRKNLYEKLKQLNIDY